MSHALITRLPRLASLIRRQSRPPNSLPKLPAFAIARRPAANLDSRRRRWAFAAALAVRGTSRRRLVFTARCIRIFKPLTGACALSPSAEHNRNIANGIAPSSYEQTENLLASSMNEVLWDCRGRLIRGPERKRRAIQNITPSTLVKHNNHTRRRNSASASALAGRIRLAPDGISSLCAAVLRKALCRSTSAAANGRRRALLLVQNRTYESQAGILSTATKMETLMAFSLFVVSGIALVAFGFARLKTLRSQKQNVQTLFSIGK